VSSVKDHLKVIYILSSHAVNCALPGRHGQAAGDSPWPSPRLRGQGPHPAAVGGRPNRGGGTGEKRSKARTGLHGYFAPSYVRWGGGFGNAILTRGRIVEARVHPLPCVGEPRALLEATIRLDGATVSFYATHLTTWGRLNSKIRSEQLSCLAREVRTSRYPYILAGDFNTGPDSPEMKAFRRENAAQLATQGIGPTFPRWKEQIDYIFADYGWQVRTARVWPMGTSDHLPVTAELMWER
jgi:endonuclease/exonuclease/phosphatase family metal-dependent hydrolase